MSTGLFLGKFAPFHRGHQFVIESALSEVDKLIVIIYDCPQTTNTPLQVRSSWIKKLYPQVKVMDAWNGPTQIGYTKKIKKMQEDYILDLLQGKKITHFYSSEPYGDHMSKSLNAKNCLVNLQRNKVPISATKIRKNLHKYKNYLDPIVYKDLIYNIVILGAPSSGKTTLTKKLAKKYNTICMPEYGREYWEKNQIGRRLTLKQLLEIAQGHIKREDKLLTKANKFLFTDTNAMTTYLFSLYYHNKANSKLKKLAKDCYSRYDLVFVCDIDIPYDNTWDRSGETNREIFQKQILADLKERKVPFIILNGSLKERTKKVEKILNQFKKYKNLMELKIQ